jgi:hypothetical protein
MNDLDETERILEAISRKAPPAGLKENVLSAAHRKEKHTLILNPVFRTAASLCCILIALALFSDMWIARSQTKRLTALLEYSPLTEQSQEAKVQELIAELGSEDLGRGLSQRMLKRFRIQERTARTENISKILSRVWEDINEDQD